MAGSALSIESIQKARFESLLCSLDLHMNSLIHLLFTICTIICNYYIKHDSFLRNYTMLTEVTDMLNLAHLYIFLDLCS